MPWAALRDRSAKPVFGKDDADRHSLTSKLKMTDQY